ncbi:MAG: tRNA preQ1(34) S-adenosylmethionine ribosyltransferase-isomerase QueA [Lachnospiraceae bacterium]|nr:tRNA preQ1(34) S-adenosylmethionine ribosyltransferase-isomerase QueA [Lachnospiraceae bacterium]
MKTSDFYYELPPELIAQDPLSDRSSSKLLVLDNDSKRIEHRIFSDVTDYLKKGDVLVLNDTKVIPARLLGNKEDTGAAVEVFLLKRLSGDTWETIVRPGKKLRPGARAVFGDGRLKCEITDSLPDGNRIVRFEFVGVFEEILDVLGQMPLPPYITHKLADKNRYQTVYAKNDGSAAAPTAGLHFTNELLAKIKGSGVDICFVTLHVGLGTFRPVKCEDISDHHMHSEWYSISEDSAKLINEARSRGGHVICVGTTSCRTVESAADEKGVVHAGSGDTDIFIYPGYRFKVLDGLITNFHLPESTLLMLVSALAGKDAIMDAYKEAIEQRYRFFSFGDAMFILPHSLC